MKIPRTMNEQYKIIRAEDEEQRKRKTSVKREVTPSVCRSIMGALRAPIPPSHGENVNPHILSISIPTGDATLSSAFHDPTLPIESPNSTFSS